MSTPIIFIFFPFVLAIGLYFLQKRTRLSIGIAIGVSIVLMLFAFFQNFGGVWKIGPVSIEIKSSLSILGRSFSLTNQDKFFLVYIYLFAALWFGATRTVEIPSNFISFALAIIALLTAALAVEPFIYSAILVEIAVLTSVPLLIKRGTPAGKGIIRFLVYQALAMPLILFGGWLQGGIQASPSDTSRLLQSVIFLGIGFAIWLAVVPFQNWVSQLTSDLHPFISGFLLGVFPVVTMLIMVDFISGLVWLRESEYLGPTLRLMGTIMVVTTGVWSAIEKDLRRLLGYLVLLECGLALIAISLQSDTSVYLLFLSFLPRLGAFALMSLSLSVISANGFDLKLENLEGLLRKFPFASMGIIISISSVAGSPLLGGFPMRLALLEQTVQKSPAATVWVLFGLAAFLFSAVRVLMQFSKPVDENWRRGESLLQTILISIGILMLVAMGLFPHVFANLFQTLFVNLPILR